MTAIDQPVQLDLGACDWCDHDQWGHVRGKKACRDPGCPCTEYTAPKRPAPTAEPEPTDDEVADEIERLTAELAEERVEVANLRRVNVELGRARGEIERLAREKRELVDERDEARKVRAKAVADLDAALRNGTAAATNVIGRYEAHACLVCGGRYGQPYTDHGCGPLTPVVVIIARQEVPDA